MGVGPIVTWRRRNVAHVTCAYSHCTDHDNNDYHDNDTADYCTTINNIAIHNIAINNTGDNAFVEWCSCTGATAIIDDVFANDDS